MDTYKCEELVGSALLRASPIPWFLECELNSMEV